jgi:hypothetical protein
LTLSGTVGEAYVLQFTSAGLISDSSNNIYVTSNQTITFNNPGSQNFGTTPTLSATSDSGLTVSFTSSTTGVCTITAQGAMTFITAGTCTINASPITR